jgi:hypothetical protein
MQLLHQLLSLLLAHVPACNPAEVEAAALDLCRMTQHRLDGLHVGRLAQALTTAAATASAAVSPGQQSGVQHCDAANTAIPLSERINCPTAAGPLPTTPTLKLRRQAGRQGNAATAPRSRLFAMQQPGTVQAAAAHGSDSDNGGDPATAVAEPSGATRAVGALADAMSTQLRIKAAPVRVPRASAAVHRQRVRFSEAEPSGSPMVPPTSIARHAVRRDARALGDAAAAGAVQVGPDVM